eukprot:TRINITY_DN31239_c0_g1_i1.p1 TRINITY_DN31239_c0_g1~~TRINITY_DN31239_c0_g1_i1.p1  ORF type:complete len:392 (-),score=49.65 TRINITY_DN31239_c0_g1_i1:190-1296(-)
MRALSLSSALPGFARNCWRLSLPSLPAMSKLHSSSVSTDIPRCFRDDLVLSELKSRAALKLEGNDVLKFLQSLTTNQMQLLSPDVETNSLGKTLIYSGFLSVQGRVLFDAFIYRDVPGKFFIDCDSTLVADLEAHLRKYKMRSKIDISNVSSSFKVFQFYGNDVASLDPQLASQGLFPDPRAGPLGYRGVRPADFSLELPSGTTPVRHASDDDYRLFRTLLGVPEGASDITSGQALPFEVNMDYLQAISFSKGCYLGQELTSRTHYVGVIRKRLLPVVPAVDGSLVPPVETPLLSASGQKTGKIVSSVGAAGLAMVRLEHVDLEQPERTLFSVDQAPLSLRVARPVWWDAFLREKHDADEKLAKLVEA